MPARSTAAATSPAAQPASNRRFTRTAAAARQIVQEDAGAGSWHLATIERDERPLWQRMLYRSVPFGPGRGRRPPDYGWQEPGPSPVDRLSAPPRSATTTLRAVTSGSHGRMSEEDLARRLAPPPAEDTPARRERPPWRPEVADPVSSSHDHGAFGRAASPALSGADRVFQRRFGPPAVSGDETPCSPDERPARHLPTLSLAFASSSAGASPSSPSTAFGHATGKTENAVVLWARRRSPMWSVYLPIPVQKMFSKASPDGARRRRWLVNGVALAVLLAGAFIIVHRDQLERAATMWTAVILASKASDNGGAGEPAEAAPAPGDVAGVVRPPSTEVPAAAPAPPAARTAATRPPAEPEPASVGGAPAQAGAGGSDTPLIEWQHLYRLGHELQGKGELEAAAEMFGLAARLNPAHGALLYDWGYLLQTQGKEQAAIEKYRAAVKLDPTHPYAHYNLGYLLQRQGDNEAALANYEKAAESHAENPYLQYDWGVVLERLGRVDQAARRYRRAIELAPDGQPGKDAHQRLVALGIED